MVEKIRKNNFFRKHFKKALKPALLPVWFYTQKTWLWQSYQGFMRQYLPDRETHAFCVGLPKTGTHSIANMLRCNAAHEPETQTLLYLYKLHKQGKLSIDQQVRILRARDVQLWLELESNFMLGLVIKALVQAFPDAKYILTVRNPYSWLESQVNQQIEFGHIEPWKSAFYDMFGNHPHTEHDLILRHKKLNSVAGYLSYWAEYNKLVIENIPKENLLTVNTSELTAKSSSISDFVGAKGVNASKTHTYARKEKKLRVSELVEPSYITEMIEFYTSDVQKKITEKSEGI